MKAKALLVTLALAATAALAATPAVTDNCSASMQAIDAVLPKVKQRSAAEMNEIKYWRTEGERLHDEGKHPEALAALDKAKLRLRIK